MRSVREIDSGVLSPYRSPLYGLGWLVLMVLGLITAAAGLVLRRRVRAPRAAAYGPCRRHTADADAAAVDSADLDPAAVGPDDPSHGVDAGVRSEIPGRFLDEEEEAALWPDAEASVDRAMAGAASDVPRGASGNAAEGGTDRSQEEDALEGDASEHDVQEHDVQEHDVQEGDVQEDDAPEHDAQQEDGVEDAATAPGERRD